MKADRYLHDPIGFIDRFIRRNEKGEPWSLSWYQRRVIALALRFDETGRLLLRLLLWSEAKKSGKSFIAGVLALWWGFTRADTEIIIAANDLEQSKSRVFQTIVKLIKHNGELKRSVRIKATEIHISNGTTIKAIPSDYRGEAGSRHSLAIFDELWGYDSESAQRLFEELTPPPTEANAWILIVTTAGFTNESTLLERLYQRGLTGARLDDDLEVYRDADLTMFWSHTPRQPWQSERYYAEQQRLLRPTTFQRLHRNEWTSAESVFITAELWDRCVNAERGPLAADTETPIFVGIDASTKDDTTSVQCVRWEGDRIGHVCGRIWRPSKEEPIDLELTVEAYVRELHRRFTVEAVVYDPYQLHRSAATLKQAGIPMQEFPQTEANLTAMGSTLFDLLKGRKFMVGPDAELRAQALNTAAVDTPRGFKIAKQKASRKIDAIVALAMACRTAIDAGAEPVVTSLTWGRSSDAIESPVACRPPWVVSDSAYLNRLALQQMLEERRGR